MKKLIEKIKEKRLSAKNNKNKKDLEKKAVEGTKKALKEYRGVFERLAEYDRV